ncbi:hypothetical protein [Deinococcus cellulosilyticus]|uniref:Uncharacterized protein n=1 Tax=Deinococcus cellulosilyticus (strain DSM 18568 / NBRC 106333 / KACC 11606 / 5516J-15) TaxID=1223518 RepID=A0A511N9S9_DEIC1|nr:hypothetical protein [Deinococcus cellulosilyticus]GEM49276.1 hypothetical protein DC3_49110 [Deinococcus cellulosilyticus NBRC 106333 = KACC 11606]
MTETTSTVSTPQIRHKSSTLSYQKPTLTTQGTWQHLTTQVGSFPFEP